jgi:hypothetical protein
MSRLLLGLVFVAVGLLLALLGGSFMGPDMHPIATGLIAIGLVMTGASLVERRLDTRAPRQRHHDQR